mgnify:CR=1 FL=1
MIRRDASARFAPEPQGCFFRRMPKYRLIIGGNALALLEHKQYQAIRDSQATAPVAVFRDDTKKKTWWLYKDEFYWEDEGYQAHEVEALILDRQRRRERRVQRAIAAMAQDQVLDPKSRPPIPDDVKTYVWQRDAGRCVICGSSENLEFDHIIPVSKGGSSTARNIQLLCER